MYQYTPEDGITMQIQSALSKTNNQETIYNSAIERERTKLLDQLTAAAARERDLRQAITPWMPEIRAMTEASHLMDGFKNKPNKMDNMLAVLESALAATETKEG